MPIYLDHNASSPVRAEVADRVARAMREHAGNASSVHYFGQQAKSAIDDARSAVARLIGAEPSEIVFTSGGTEADNMAVRGAADGLASRTRHRIVTTAIEHEAVLNTVKALGTRGSPITILPVSSSGVVDWAGLPTLVGDDAALVSVMLANNETGVLQPVRAIADSAHARGALVHTDAVQAVGKIPVDVRALGVDLLSLSGHKFGAPQGVGALWIRRGTSLLAYATGGRQERGRRAGTENVAAIEGLGVAAALALAGLSTDAPRIMALRDRLESALLASVPGTVVNGATERRVPNTTNLSFDRVEGESLVIALDLEGIAVSTGSACSSGTLEPSHVLRAMGLAAARVQSAIRVSLGPATTDAEIDRVLEVLPKVVGRLRAVAGSRG
ncbi:MAG: cysteine desulfurase family protein [Acidobacteria bacterium]|nr:cysteine desulfurase family protein [Acidobacteriota bacterium]